VEKKIKRVGLDDAVFPENPKYEGKNLKECFTQDLRLSSNIPIIEGLTHLGSWNIRSFSSWVSPQNWVD
jgi:hypothetical protein